MATRSNALGTFVASLSHPGWQECPPRLTRLVKGWHRGQTGRALAQEHGISVERVRQLLNAARRRYFSDETRGVCLDPDRIEQEWASIMARSYT